MSIFQRYFKNKRRNLIILLILILPFLILLILFYQDKASKPTFAKFKDFIFQETENKKFLFNKKDGIKIEIPENWGMVRGVDLGGTVFEDIITFFTSDFSFKPPTGCAIEFNVKRFKKQPNNFYLSISPKEIKESIEKIENAPENQKDEQRKVIEINGFKALQETHNLPKIENAKDLSIELPTKTRVLYFFVTSFSTSCQEKINDFLNKITIENK
ncbi:MAG: hypothetical protein ACP5H7_01765 [Minisyncoccia bacterium]